jgi:transposase
MELYAGIDLHSNNNYLCIINQEDQRLHEVKLQNNIKLVLRELVPFQKDLKGIVVESTYNWYWLIDGLEEAKYRVHLANPAKNTQYSGLKNTNDKYDAFWLAHLKRLGLLAEGYIYPKEERGVRDLMRKRSQLVHFSTANILSFQNLYSRNSGSSISGNAIKQLLITEIPFLASDPNLVMAMECNWGLVQYLKEQIGQLEKSILSQVKLRPEFQHLLSIEGVGKILALTIMLETGDIGRFESVGDFASYSRGVPTLKSSNGKKKGEGNRKNGNKYLAWAFVEAAHFFIRYNSEAKRFYQKKAQKTKQVVAIKALAHKLARASYFIMRDQVDFDPSKLFKS